MRTVIPFNADVASKYPDNRIVNGRYTAWNFLPTNLYEQFRRPLNFYFLLVSLLQCISVIAPVNPLSSFLPLTFAFLLTAFKEGLDDIKRHRQDRVYNRRIRLVLDSDTATWIYKLNEEIRVGDVIMLQDNEDVPCDVVVVAATSTPVYIRTDNLDGEMDLKSREVLTAPMQVPLRTSLPSAGGRRIQRSALCEVDEDASSVLEKLKCVRIRCPPPDPVMDSFNARVEFCPSKIWESPSLNVPAVSDTTDMTLSPFLSVDTSSTVKDIAPQSISHLHLLPQFSVLRNTEKVMVLAVYTGADTKCGKNKHQDNVKWSRIDKDINRYFIIVFVCQLGCALTMGIVGALRNRHVQERFWYLPSSSEEGRLGFFLYPLRFFLLCSAMIPISFKFIVDISKCYMAMVVEWDKNMVHTKDREGCRVKNSGILEDLGQIDYVLSDKTGTMTQNVLTLRYVAFGNDEEICISDLDGTPSLSSSVISSSGNPVMNAERSEVSDLIKCSQAAVDFGVRLALCNTVNVVMDDGNLNTIKYQALSADEDALCLGATKLNVWLTSREKEKAQLNVNGLLEGWTVHYSFPFLSEKKTMGVIVEHNMTERIWFFLKGADDRVIRLASKKSSNLDADMQTSADLTDVGRGAGVLSPFFCDRLVNYAKMGMRTLLFAEKELSRSQLTDFMDALWEAELEVGSRQAKLDSLREEMERNVQIVGITAIEDELQPHVVETVKDFLSAGVKVWMLTGDKVETAEKIGIASGLYNYSDRVVRIAEDAEDADGWITRLNTVHVPAPHSATRSASGLTRAGGSSPDNTSVPLFGDIGETEKSAIKDATGADSSEHVVRYDQHPETNVPLQEHIQDKESLFESESSLTDEPSRTVLILQGGQVLDRILQSTELLRKLDALSRNCVSVICGRVTPRQKAAITMYVRSKGYMTLAVGDGGNDIAMLQEAHVGVGIVGKEGQQAARVADFSISRFSDLRSLVFVHGQQSYVRTAYVIKYSFYKSVLICFIQLAYNITGTHFSGTSFWNSYFLLMWNGVYTLPQTVLYCLDRCAPRVVLERNPFLYKLTRWGADINAAEFFYGYMMRGALQSIMLLLFMYTILGPGIAFPETGSTETVGATSCVAYTALILVQMITVLFESHSLTYWNVFWIVGMPFLTLTVSYTMGCIRLLPYYGAFHYSISMVGVLNSIAISSVLVCPFLIIFAIRDAVLPNSRDVLRRLEVKQQRALLRNKAYREKQSVWVRWFGFVPEAESCYTEIVSSNAKMYFF